MRQSVLSHWEAPFIYLLAGEERAILMDTGANGMLPLRETVDDLIGADSSLIVGHSHAHGDHVAGDWQFSDRPNTVIVGHAPEQVAQFFGINHWPTEMTVLELGRRKIDVIPIPGHEASGIALYDELTGLLLTNDTLYPGRLYVRDFLVYRSSMERLAAFIADRTVAWLLGCHIEMTNEIGIDYDLAAPSHPNEHELQLGREHLLELCSALQAMGNEPRRDVHDDFIITPLLDGQTPSQVLGSRNTR